MSLRPNISGWRDWLILAMCGAWLLCLVWIGLSAKQVATLTSESAAAWVQAVGAFVAILAAVVVAWSEHRRGNRIETQGEIDLLDTLGAIALAAEGEFRNASSQAKVFAVLGSAPRPIVQPLLRHCETSRALIDRIMQGRLARAGILLAAADLTAALQFGADETMLTNPALFEIECSDRADAYASIARRFEAFRRRL